MFIQTLSAQVGRMCFDDMERQALLRSFQSEDIQSYLGQALLHTGLYRESLFEFQHRLGNLRFIAAGCSRALFDLLVIKDQ